METRLAENIRVFRKRQGLTQEQLAEVLGVTVGAVHKWETRMSTPELGLITEMADFFDISVDVLLGYEMKDNRLKTTVERLWKARKPMEQGPEERDDDEHCQGTAQKEHGAPVARKGDRQRMTEEVRKLYALDNYELWPVPGHEGGRNLVYVCSLNGEKKYVLRISALGDRTEEEYLAETEFVQYLAQNGAPVADAIPSVRGKLVERMEQDGITVFVTLFEYAKGMLLSDNGYRYREGAPLDEYFNNTDKALGAIHRLSRQYRPVHHRRVFFDKYTAEYIDSLIPDSYADLKQAICRRLEEYQALPKDPENYGLIHFDFCDGNYHVDLETGDITVFDFDNCIYCWYMFDLAHLWTHGVGWYRHIPNAKQRMACMDQYFRKILEGYRSETDVSDAMLEKLPLFIDMTIIEFVIDEFECCAREGGEPDEEDIGNAVCCLVNDIPYGGFGEEW